MRGHPAVGAGKFILFNVSSHAPVRGHRHGANTVDVVIVVSSHAPVRGHLWQNGDGAGIRSFKSCPREGASTVSKLNTAEEEFQVMPP